MEDSHLACIEIPIGTASTTTTTTSTTTTTAPTKTTTPTKTNHRRQQQRQQQQPPPQPQLHQTLQKGHAIFGVFDGHGGQFTSNYASKNFLRILSNNESLRKYSKLKMTEQYDVPGVTVLKTALTETFCELDRDIRKRQIQLNRSDNFSRRDYHQERSGSTIVIVMITPSHIICANAGDSRAVLRRNGKAMPLSFDHKPSNLPELERINTAGGFVKHKRVDGDLAVSRGLGDFSYKSIDGLPVKDQKVIPHPEFVIYPRDLQHDEFIILACDGIWDVATNKDCADFTNHLLEEGETDLGLICEIVLDSCLDKHSRDNMTFAILTFDGARTSKGMTPKGTVWKRRTLRQVRQFERSAKAVASNAVMNLQAVTVGGGK